MMLFAPQHRGEVTADPPQCLPGITHLLEERRVLRLGQVKETVRFEHVAQSNREFPRG